MRFEIECRRFPKLAFVFCTSFLAKMCPTCEDLNGWTRGKGKKIFSCSLLGHLTMWGRKEVPLVGEHEPTCG